MQANAFFYRRYKSMKSSIDIFFFEAFAEEQDALLHFLPEEISAGFSRKTPQELGVSKRPPAPIISVRTQSNLPPTWASQLQGIISRSTGYDHMSAYRQTSGLPDFPCGYLPHYCNRAVAEQAMLMWLALLRNFKQQLAQFSDFNRDGLTGTEILGKTLLVVGVGNIGSEVVKIGKGLDMRVLCCDIASTKHPDQSYVSLEEGIAEANIIVCAMNLTAENHALFDYNLLKKTKKGTIFINISRGEQSPAEDLLRLLEEGQLGGVGLDVYPYEKELAVAFREKRYPDRPELRAIVDMAGRTDVIFTPHNAFNTDESVSRKASQTIDQFLAFREKGKFIWEVPKE